MTSKSRFSVCLAVIVWLATGLPAWAASQGSLVGSGDGSSLARDLTAEGSTDWVYWYNSPPEHKSGGGTQFGSLTAINPNGGNQPSRCGGDPRTLTWSDGTTTAISATGSGAGMCSSGASNGYSFTVAADTTPRTLLIHVGGGNASGLLTAHLSDSSATDYADTVPPTNNTWDHNYMLTYNAASAGQTLTVTWTAASITALGGGVTISAAALRPAGSPFYFTGKVATQYSPAEMVVNGNLLYSCELKWVSVVDVTDPTNAQLLGTSPSTNPNPFNNDGNLYCALQRGSLVAFVENLTAASGNGFVYFDLSTPKSPQLKTATKINKAAFEEPAYAGNAAFVPTIGYQSFGGAVTKQFGDVVAVDVTSFDKPAVVGTLEQQTDPVAGGAYNVFGTTTINSQTIYVATTSATGDTTKGGNNGTGQLLVVDVTNPAAMSVVKTLAVPGTVQLFKPVIQGNLAVAVGDSTGWNGVYFGGNLVVVTLDVTNPRNPVILGSVTTNNAPIPSLPPPMAAIGNSLFLVGARDAKNNNVLMQVDATDPAHPKVTNFMATYGAQRLAVSGTALFASTDPNYFQGIGTYSLPKPISGGNSGSGGTICTYTLSPPSYAAPATAGPSTVNVTTQAGCAWTAVVQGNASWLHVNTGYAGTGAGTVTFSFDANSGAARSGTILIAARAFTVTQASPTACSYSLSASSYSAASTAGQSSVNVTTQAGCTWTAAVQGSATAWLHIPSNSASGTGSGTVTFSFDANTGAARSGTTTIASQTFTVTQAAAPACTYTINPINAYVAYGGGSATVAVTAGSACAWTATSSVGWITITAGASGTGNGTVSYTVAANTTSAERTGNLTIAGQSFPVTEDGVPSAAAPTLSAGGVVNAADYTANFAPGMIISLFGSNFATAVTNASTIPLPNSLAGVSVEVVDGSQVLNAPLFFVSQLQINAQLPFNMTSSSVQVRVRNARGVSGTQTIAITPRSPRLFTQTMDGKGDAIVVHADYSVVTANSPGTPGETLILFLTGLGAVSPSIAAGQAGGDGTAGKPLNLVTDPVTVTVGSAAAMVAFKGLAPDYAGLYQINFQVPNSPIYGSEPITVSAGKQSSQSTATMSVGMQQTSLGSGTVGPAGGTVSAGSTSITLPAGILTSPAQIAISKGAGPTAFDDTRISDIYTATNVPLTQNAPVTLTIDLPSPPSNPDQVSMVVQVGGEGAVPYLVQAQVSDSHLTATFPETSTGAGAASMASIKGMAGNSASGAGYFDNVKLWFYAKTHTTRTTSYSPFSVASTTGFAPDNIGNFLKSAYAAAQQAGLFNNAPRKVQNLISVEIVPHSFVQPWGFGVVHPDGVISISESLLTQNGLADQPKLTHIFMYYVLNLWDTRTPTWAGMPAPDSWTWLDEAIATWSERVFDPSFIPPLAIANADFIVDTTGLEFPVSGGDPTAALNHGSGASMFLEYLMWGGGSTYIPTDADGRMPAIKGLLPYRGAGTASALQYLPVTALGLWKPDLMKDWDDFSLVYTFGQMIYKQPNGTPTPLTPPGAYTSESWADYVVSYLAAGRTKTLDTVSNTGFTDSWNAPDVSMRFYSVGFTGTTPDVTVTLANANASDADVYLYPMSHSNQIGTAMGPITNNTSFSTDQSSTNFAGSGNNLLIVVVNKRAKDDGLTSNLTLTVQVKAGTQPPPSAGNGYLMFQTNPPNFNCPASLGGTFIASLMLDTSLLSPNVPVQWAGDQFTVTTSGQSLPGQSGESFLLNITGSVPGMATAMSQGSTNPLTGAWANVQVTDKTASSGTYVYTFRLQNLTCQWQDYNDLQCAVPWSTFNANPATYMTNPSVTFNGAACIADNSPGLGFAPTDKVPHLFVFTGISR